MGLKMKHYLIAAGLSTLAIAAIVGTTFAGVTTPPAPIAAEKPAAGIGEETWHVLGNPLGYGLALFARGPRIHRPTVRVRL
jgi:hypothetical protein